MKKERRDVLRSRESIKNAFIKLSIKKSFNKMTVADILDLANVSRGTFYVHFRDIYDVRNQVEDDLLNECKEIMMLTDIYEIAKDPYPQILKALNFLQEHADSIQNLSGDSGDGFLIKLKEIFIHGLIESAHTIQDQNSIELIDTCIIGAVIDGCMKYCSQKDKIYSSEKAAKIISTFIASGINVSVN
jgi:AcrR family transcriptional regulator